MITYRIAHTTEYHYSEPASLSYNEARLLPRSFATPLFAQQVTDHKLEVEPEWRDARGRQDSFGNHVVYFTMRRPHSVMRINVINEVTIEPSLPPADFPGYAAQSPAWEQVRARLAADRAQLPYREFMLDSPLVRLFDDGAAYAVPSFTPGRPILEAAFDLMHRIHTDFAYEPGTTTITTPLPEVYAAKRGVCQDFAQFMLACLRSQGLACRYVSGYIENRPPPGQEKLLGSDASHAWVALYVPERGWIDFDPTNAKIATDQHITLGWGRDFSDVTPLKGIFFGGGKNELSVAVDVRRIDGVPAAAATSTGT
jgi:transglutaminase-like putative cysteine protease